MPLVSSGRKVFTKESVSGREICISVACSGIILWIVSVAVTFVQVNVRKSTGVILQLTLFWNRNILREFI